MTETDEERNTRTVARCDNCGSVYVAKVCSDGSLSLDGLAACPCGDSELSLLDTGR